MHLQYVWAQSRRVEQITQPSLLHMYHYWILCQSISNKQCRAAVIGWLIDQPIKRKLVANYFDNRLIVSVIFQAKTSNICWSQLLKCQDFLLLFVVYDGEERASGFWTAGWTKDAIWRRHFGLWETVMSIFHNFLMFHRLSQGLVTCGCRCGSLASLVANNEQYWILGANANTDIKG